MTSQDYPTEDPHYVEWLESENARLERENAALREEVTSKVIARSFLRVLFDEDDAAAWGNELVAWSQGQRP